MYRPIPTNHTLCGLILVARRTSAETCLSWTALDQITRLPISSWLHFFVLKLWWLEIVVDSHIPIHHNSEQHLRRQVEHFFQMQEH
jgi:hypothetical protein